MNINDHFILSKILVPFFDNLHFLTKKELDFKDWKNILKLKTHAAYARHLSKEGADLIMEIAKNMNNHRLSNYKVESETSLNNIAYVPAPAGVTPAELYTNSSEVVASETVTQSESSLKGNCYKLHVRAANEILVEKVNDLLSRPSNFEITSNGKIFIKSEQKFFFLFLRQRKCRNWSIWSRRCIN